MNVTRKLSGRSFFTCRFGVLSALALFFIAVVLTGCKSKTSAEGDSAAPPPDSLELTFTYGSEKEKWINEVTDAFNRGNNRTSGGKHIFVRAIPMGSGEAIDEVLE